MLGRACADRRLGTCKLYPQQGKDCLRECSQDWLYDEGEDESKAVYVAKLKELEALGEPVLVRAREAGARPGAAAALMQTANRLIQIASASDAKHAHIPQEDKEKVCSAPVDSRWVADLTWWTAVCPNACL